MSRPRVLTVYLDAWYGRPETCAPSSETMQFGGGLFDSMGFDEVHVPMEWFVEDAQGPAMRKIEDRLKSHYPYEWALVVPFKTVDPIIQEVCREAPVVAWMSDCVHRYSDFGRYWAGAADYIVTTDAASLPKYGGKGILSNWGCRAEWARYAEPLKKSDWDIYPPSEPRLEAFFHGQCYGERTQRLEQLAKAGDVIVNWRDAVGKVVTERDYFYPMSRAVFSLCLTAAISGKPQMKSRLFEPQVLGSILVTEPTPRLEEYWRPGEECVVFIDAADCQRQMRALLDDGARLAAMREAAKTRALAEHTYERRFRSILATMGVAIPTAVEV